jgi:GTP-binding protein
MKESSFLKARFVASAFDLSQLPLLKNLSGQRVPEVALVGKSNVGKSSLINDLSRNGTLARISSSPGKTQSINFYLIDDALALVDLPGYGYASVSKEKRKGWGDLIEKYLTERTELALVLLLIDSRRGLSEEDFLFVDWARAHGKPLFVVFTKTDKLSQSEKALLKSPELLAKIPESEFLCYSIKDSKARIHLIYTIYTYLGFNGPHS